MKMKTKETKKKRKSDGIKLNKAQTEWFLQLKIMIDSFVDFAADFKQFIENPTVENKKPFVPDVYETKKIRKSWKIQYTEAQIEWFVQLKGLIDSLNDVAADFKKTIENPTINEEKPFEPDVEYAYYRESNGMWNRHLIVCF